MKKLISVLLTVTMLLTLFVAAVPASASEATLGNDTQEASYATDKKATVAANHVPADFDGDGVTDAGAKKITTVAELKGIVAGDKAYLANDLLIKPEDKNGNIVLIGGWFTQNVYLDGCGYTIEFDKSVDTTTQTAVALFNGGTQTFTIKNLNVTGVMNTTDALDTHFGVLCKHGGSAIVENVVVDVDITLNVIKSGTAGMWAKLDGSCSATFKNAHFTGSINAKVSPTDSYGGIGGFIGEKSGAGTATFENCSNTGTITLSADARGKGIGGFIGTMVAGNTGKVTIKNSTSSANIAVGNTQIAYVGGFVGLANPQLEITSSTASGTLVLGNLNAEAVAGKDFGGNIGGFVGRIAGVHNADIVAKIKRSNNMGTITVNNNPSVSAGGIVGYSSKAYLEIDGCQNSGEIKVRNSEIFGTYTNIHTGVGGIIGTIGNEWSGGNEFAVSISNCTNKGNISSFKKDTSENSVNVYAGGIVGRVYATSSLDISGCVNNGNIDTSLTGAWSIAGGIVGGIVCYCADSDFTWSGMDKGAITVTKCMNTGSMNGGRWAGGIIGAGMQLFTDDLVINVSYCINEGEIKAGMNTDLAIATSAAAGGIVGLLGWEKNDSRKQFGRLALEYCVNRAAVTAGPSALAAGGILGYMNGDSLIGITSSGTDSKEAAQQTWYNTTCDSYTQKTWIDYCGNDGDITCQNGTLDKEGKPVAQVASIAGSIKNKYYLWNSQALGTRTLGTAAATTNAWVVDAWVAQAGNDQNATKMETLVAEVQQVISASIVDKAELEATIAEAKALVSGDYTPDSWSILQLVIADAEAAMSAKTQDAVDAAVESLKDAIAALEPVGGENPYPPADDGNEGGNNGEESEVVDYTALEDAIDQAVVFDEDEYTVETWNALSNALDTAYKALNSTSQSEVDSATSSLKNAIKNLGEPDYELLEAMIAEAEGASESDYSADNWEALISAIDDAKAVLNSRSQEEIDGAAIALSDALEATLDVESGDGDTEEEGSDEAEDEGDVEEEDASDDATDNNDEGNTDTDTDNKDNGNTDVNDDTQNGGNTENGENDDNTDDNTDGESDTEDSESESEEDKKSDGGKTKKGCKSAIAASTAVLATVIALGVGFKKKED